MVLPLPAPASKRLHAVEVARGLACGGVLLFHSLTALPPASLHPVLRFIRSFTEHGWLGVNVFFAVSGWCIAERLGTAHRRDEPSCAFLRERFLRIYPAYWAALAALFLVRAAATPFNTTHLLDNFPSGATAWLGDIFLVQPYLGTTPALVVSWSLVYELGFYVLGASALLLRRQGVRAVPLVGIGALLVLPSLLSVQSGPIYVLGLWPDFFVGVLAWRASRLAWDGAAKLSAVLLFTLFTLAVALDTRFGGLGRLIAVLSALALWLASRHDVDVHRFGALRGLAWLGGISYSLYLIHVTVLSPVMNLGERFIRSDQGAFSVIWLTAVSLALLSGWALHRWLEAPVERWRKRRWSARPALV